MLLAEGGRASSRVPISNQKHTPSSMPGVAKHTPDSSPAEADEELSASISASEGEICLDLLGRERR